MCDMEVHEHVMISGETRTLEERILHRNVENLSRYIQKHNEYSNWEVRVSNDRAVGHEQLEPSLWGSQAERRRWLRKKLLGLPGSPAFFFLYRYVLRPASMPALAASLRQGFSFAWRSLMGAELLFAVQNHGLGFELETARNLRGVQGVIAVMSVMVMIGIAADRLVFARLERRVLVRFGLAQG